MGLHRVSAHLPSAVGRLKGHQPGGVEQEGVQVLCMDGPMERWLRTTPFNFRQQVLNLLNGYQDLVKEKQIQRQLLITFKHSVPIHLVVTLKPPGCFSCLQTRVNVLHLLIIYMTTQSAFR